MSKTKEEIAAAYDSAPWWYDLRGFLILTFAYNNSLTSQMRFFGPHFGPRHLEVACGTGTLLAYILRWRKWMRLPRVSIVGVDYADSMLEGARRRFAGQTDMEFHLADVAALPFETASFDTANVANAIHCFPDVEGALRDLHRVLKPQGTLAVNALLYPRGIWPLRVIADWIEAWGMRKGILVTPFREDDIRQRIIGAGFVIQSEGVSGNCYNVLARKPS